MPQDSSSREPKRSSLADGLIRAEKMLQVAFILPAAVAAGWLIGVGLDKWLHQKWIYLAGIILGAAAGFVEVFRLVLGQEKAMEKDDR